MDDVDVSTLEGSPVFAGVPADVRASLVHALGVSTRAYEKGAVIKHVGDSMEYFPVILKGVVRATMPQGGQDRIVSQFRRGDSFAEAVPIVLKRCPVNIRAMEDTLIMRIPAHSLDTCEHPWAKTIGDNLRTELSKHVATLSATLAVLSEPRLTDRILAYLATLPCAEDGSVTVPYGRQDWAGVLRVADKSLIRELRLMQEAGLIKVNGRKVTVCGEPL